jgi:DNA-binding transcriptional ArsR family regulator
MARKNSKEQSKHPAAGVIANVVAGGLPDDRKGVIGGKAEKPAKKPPEPPPRRLPPHELMKALSHPLRIRILAILVDRIASPNEISKELDEGIGHVSYHVRVLVSYDLVVEDHRASRRGATEHFYRVVAPTVIPPGVWHALPNDVQKPSSVRVLTKFLNDAWASMEEGVFDEPPGELSWTPLVLDESGVEKVGQLARDFLDSVFAVEAEASKRLTEKKSQRAVEARSATVFLASFRSARSPEDDEKASATMGR